MPVRATPLHPLSIRHESFDATIALRSDCEVRPTPDASDPGSASPRSVPRADPAMLDSAGCARAHGSRGRCTRRSPEETGVGTSAHPDAAAEREERDAAADGDTRRTLVMRDATLSLHVCT